MPRTSPQARAVRDTADAQLGLITAAQLADIGVHGSTASRRALGGMWTRVLPGVHLVHGGMPTRDQREMAALLYAGPRSLLTGVSSLRHHGFRALQVQDVSHDVPERPEPVHVLIPHDRRRLSTGYVRVERTHRFPDDVAARLGRAYTLVPRAVGDAARRSQRASDVLALVSEAVQRELASVADLEAELRAGPMRGSAHLRDALRAVADGARSAPEGDLARLLAAAGIRHVLYNAVLVTESGHHVATADAWLDDVGLALEVDSLAHHASPADFASTLRRNARYAAAGVPFLAILPSDLRSRPAGTLNDILRARAAAAARPRARVAVSRHAAVSAGRTGWRWGA